MDNSHTLQHRFQEVRQHTVNLCEPLEIEDYVIQPISDVSPPKWHLGHTTWFFETFVLQPHFPGYHVYHPQYNYVFNSYYETIGARVIRTDRGNLSRPTVKDVYRYRAHVDQHMAQFLNSETIADHIAELIILGINHEQQHQELLITDIKYILGHNPLFPAYSTSSLTNENETRGISSQDIQIPEGIYEIGYTEDGFSYDNELGRHRVYLNAYSISPYLITNREYLDFIEDGGYQDFRHWHAEGWDWVKQRRAKSPLYWHDIDGKWMNYTLQGLQEVETAAPVCHVNYYEASAYASWIGERLPTEAEWEIASEHFAWGLRWEWTTSAYHPYPRYKKEAGAIGEYNSKFMVNQLVLRGASEATPPGHSRPTYRNFFHAQMQWQFTGIRLATHT